MVKVLVQLNDDGYVKSYRLLKEESAHEESGFVVEIPQDHPFFSSNISSYRIVSGKLVKENTLVVEQAKSVKKKHFSKVCQEKILHGFEFVWKGKLYHFSYDYESQTNFQETYHLFQNSVIESVKWSAKLDGESVRIDLNKKDFEAVFFASVRHKQAHISKFKDQIEPLIEAQSTTEGLEAISWNGLVTNPENPGVVFKTDDTLDKQVDTLDSLTKTLNQKTELSDMAIMEIAMMVSMMMGGPM